MELSSSGNVDRANSVFLLKKVAERLYKVIST